MSAFDSAIVMVRRGDLCLFAPQRGASY